MKRVFVGLGVGVAVLAASAVGQETLDKPVEEFQQRELDSGVLVNFADEPEVVFAAVVETPDAPWLRLYFREITLIGDSAVRFTSLLDGEVQELDRVGAAMWGNASAYFNGDALLVEVIAAGGTVGNRVVLDGVGTQLRDPHTRSFCGICITDEREPSDEDWAGRLVPPGCSASIYTASSCAVSAGHCRRSNMVMQFRVPPSLPNCDIQHPPVSEQFPVVQDTFQNSGVGRDWMVMTMGTNSLGETPYERYGEYRPLGTEVAPVGATANVWGYGVSKTCTRTQTQQKSEGTIMTVFSDHYRHNATTTGGNSGSNFKYNGAIVGIVTHCNNQSGCPAGNVAQRVDYAPFVDARQQLCGDLSISALNPPSTMDQGVPATFAVTISQGADQLVPGSERLFYRYGAGSFESAALTHAGGDTYEAELPAPTVCATDAEFYVQAEGVDTGVVTDPPGGASDPFTASIACPPEPLTVEAIDPPTVLVEGEPTGFDVTVDPGDDVMISGSAQLFYRFDSGDSFTAVAMSQVSGTTWRATIPAAPCVDDAEFYVFAIGVLTGVVTDPPDGADDPFIADVDCVGCPPDWNGDGVVDSDDLFDFLSDWSSGDADYNGDGVTDSDDLFDFLADWSDPGQFPGC